MNLPIALRDKTDKVPDLTPNQIQGYIAQTRDKKSTYHNSPDFPKTGYGSYFSRKDIHAHFACKFSKQAVGQNTCFADLKQGEYIPVG